MGAINCCQNQSYKLQEFRENYLTLASPEYQSYFTSIQQQENNQSRQLKTEKLQYIAGSWKNDPVKSGKGVIFSPDHFYYEGQIAEGVAKGQGKIVWPNKYIYKGAIEGNKASGYGELLLGDKKISLKGNWVRGLPKLNDKMEINKQGRHGSITFIDESASKRQQDFFKTTLIVKVELGNKLVYEGQVKQCNKVYKIEGKGKMTYPDESYYVGDFVNGKMDGNGKYFWSATGNWFEGQYKADFRDGRGTYYYSQKEFQTGIWKGGVLLKAQSQSNKQPSQIQHLAATLL